MAVPILVISYLSLQFRFSLNRAPYVDSCRVSSNARVLLLQQQQQQQRQRQQQQQQQQQQTIITALSLSGVRIMDFSSKTDHPTTQPTRIWSCYVAQKFFPSLYAFKVTLAVENMIRR